MKKQTIRKMKNNTSSKTGVYQTKSLRDGTKRWGAFGNEKGRRRHLGSFQSFTLACVARQEWERRNGYFDENIDMTKQEKSVLLGLALGDGHLKKITNRTACLMIEHSSKQEEYATFKRSILARIFKCDIPPLRKFERKSGHEKVTVVKTHKYFKDIRNALYRNGKKTYTHSLLDRLSDEAVAIWWMDDASVRKGRKSSPKYCEAWLWTYTSKEEANKIIAFFEKKYNVSPKLVLRKSKVEPGRRYFSLRFNKADLKTLIPQLRPFACRSMLYKFPSFQNGLIDS